MKKVILLIQLICMPMLFAPRDSRGKGSIAPREIPPIGPREMQSSPSREVLSVSGLDCVMFKHWYGDCFKTKEIDGVSYFIELPERETKSPFVLLGMSAYIQVSSLSVSVPGVVQDRFKTNDKRATRFKYTIMQKIEFGEVKDMFGSMVPKVKQMMEDMLDELNDACGYGYNYTLPLDSIEVQDESGIIYLICGIEQEKSLLKNYLISEPESIRIKIKASKQSPECRMSRKHLLTQVNLPTSCPEFYMSRRYLGMYHAIYSALNAELVESLTPITDRENFSRIEGYTLIPDILQKKRNKAMDYLEEDELEPFVYIPTYQHDMLAKVEEHKVLQTSESLNKEQETIEHPKENEVELEPSVEIPVYQYDTLGENIDYGSLVFTHRDEGHYKFKTGVVNDLQYTLCVNPYEIKEAGFGDTFRLSDLIDKEIQGWCLRVSLFCPAPGKFKQSSGNTEFRYRFEEDLELKLENAEWPSDVFKNALQQAKTARDKIIDKLSEIKSVEFPLARVVYSDKYIYRILASDEGKKLNPKFDGSEGPRIDIPNGGSALGEFLTEEKLTKCRDVCELVRAKIHELLKGVTEFSDGERKHYMDVPDYVDVPDMLKKQSFWPEAKALLKKIGDNISIDIPSYLYEALVDKQHELLPFTRDNGNVFKAESDRRDRRDCRIYNLTLSDTTGLGDTFRLSDLADKEISSLWINYCACRYTINKTITGNEISNQFEIASQKVKKLYDLILEATVSICDQCIEIGMYHPEYERKKLNPKSTTSEGPKLKIPLGDENTEEKLLTKERLIACDNVCWLVRSKIHQLLAGVTKFTDQEDYVDVSEVSEVLKKESFWPEAEAMLKKIGDDMSIYIPRYLHDALVAVDRQYSLLTFTHDSGDIFKTEVINNLIYSLKPSDTTGLGDTFRLSDLAGKEITSLSVNIRPGSRYECRYNINKTIAGNEVSDQFKITSQKARRLYNLTDQAYYRVIVSICDQCIEIESIEIETRNPWTNRLNPKSIMSEGPKLKIPLSDENTEEKLLTRECLKVCDDVCELVRNKINELLKDVTEFNAGEDYVPVPDVLKRQSFWPEAEAMLKKIGHDVSIFIPRYLRDALVDKLASHLARVSMCDESIETSSDDNDISSNSSDGDTNSDSIG